MAVPGLIFDMSTRPEKELPNPGTHSPFLAQEFRKGLLLRWYSQHLGPVSKIASVVSNLTVSHCGKKIVKTGLICGQNF